MPYKAEEARNHLKKVSVHVKAGRVDVTENQIDNQIRNKHLDKVENKRQNAVKLTVSAHHICCAGVAAAGIAYVVLFENTAHNNRTVKTAYQI